MATENKNVSASATVSGRSAATQATVDRYSASPTAKRNRSLQLASEHEQWDAARAILIERGSDGLLIKAVYLVPSRSDASHPHLVTFHPNTNSATCDCPAG